MEKLILFAGGLGAGKDVMRNLYIEKMGIEKEYHFSFALPLKEEANEVLELSLIHISEPTRRPG